MSTPLDYFETDPPPAPTTDLQRVVGYFYWLGLMLLNGLLGNVWYENLDKLWLVLGVLGLYLALSILLPYTVHLLADFFLFLPWRWLLRKRPRNGWGWRAYAFVAGMMRVVQLGILSQGLVFFYLVYVLLWATV